MSHHQRLRRPPGACVSVKIIALQCRSTPAFAANLDIHGNLRVLGPSRLPTGGDAMTVIPCSRLAAGATSNELDWI
jgi:hypothetical protein